MGSELPRRGGRTCPATRVSASRSTTFVPAVGHALQVQRALGLRLRIQGGDVRQLPDAAGPGAMIPVLVAPGGLAPQQRHVDPDLWWRLQGKRPPPEFVPDGCGPNRLGPGWVGSAVAWAVHLFARDTLHGWPIWLACHFHDYGYQQGGTWVDRRRVDYECALNIVRVCRTRSWPRAATLAQPLLASHAQSAAESSRHERDLGRERSDACWR